MEQFTTPIKTKYTVATVQRKKSDLFVTNYEVRHKSPLIMQKDANVSKSFRSRLVE